MLKEYFYYIKEYWKVAELSRGLFLVNLLSAFAYKALAVAMPFIAALIIKALTEQNAEQVYHYIFVYAIVYILYRLAIYLDWRAYSWNVNYSYGRLHDKVFSKLINVDSNFTRKIDKGHFMNTINTDLISISEMSDELSEFFATIVQIFAILVIVGSYNIFFAIIIAFSRLIYVIIRNKADKRMNEYWYKTRREDDNYSNFINQVATGLQEVKTFNMLPKLYKKLDIIQNRYNKYYKNQRYQVNIRDLDVKLIYYLFHASMYLFLMIFLIRGEITLDILILVVTYHETVIDYANDFVDAATTIRLTNASVKHLENILNYQAIDDFTFGKYSKEHLNGEVVFKNVTLEIDKKKILSNISLKIKPHETVAIVGFPGAGKTMLFNLLLRLKRPNKGEILLDDIDINEYTREIYTSSVAIANQTPFIFNTTIRNNLDFVDKNISRQIEACKTAGIHDFIVKLPQGYNTVLRENASNVSGGQKQMISIARTILTDAEVLLLDDVTTALDPETATLVPNLLKRLEKNHTVIMITKKPELMASADRIVVLNNGEIEAIGTHKTLLEKSKTYRALQLVSPRKETDA